MNATGIKLRIKLWIDDCPDSPADLDGWKPYSFSTRHANFKHPDNFANKKIAAKLKSGLAFRLSYYEHGLSDWSLRGEGPSCRFDSVLDAGILVWEGPASDLGPKSYKEREADARAFIARFTEWCNGNVYGYTIEAVQKCCECGADKDAEHLIDFDLPSCGGYYADDLDGMVTDIKDSLGSDWSDYEVEFEDSPETSIADDVKRHWQGK